MNSKGRTILFAVNGLGLGNCTRSHAVIDELRVRGYQVAVATSGNGLDYFSHVAGLAGLYELKATPYKSIEDRVGLKAVLASALGFIGAFFCNSLSLFRIVRDIKPEAVVYDSVYNVAHAVFPRIRIFSLNNSDRVIRAAAHGLPRQIWAHFFLVECLDYLFQCLVAHIVISPWPEPAERKNRGKFRGVGMIVRSQLRPSPRPEARKVLMMFSGAGLRGGYATSLNNPNFELDVVGFTAPDKVGLKYWGKLMDNRKLLGLADVIVTNAGFSSISEALFLTKPLVLMPLPGHAEQHFNAAMVQRLGVGVVASPESLQSCLGTVVEKYPFYQTAYARLHLAGRGAQEAAQIIDQTLGVRSPASKIRLWTQPIRSTTWQ